MSQIEDKASNTEKKTLPLPNSVASTTNSQIQVSSNNSSNNEVEEQIIPIWGEQIILDKKMVKLGEIVIKKSKITEKRKVDVEVRKEKITIKHPDGKKEDIT